jgi:hypothetical protein
LLLNVLHGSVTRLGSNAESERIHQSQHLVIFGHDDAFHVLKAPHPGDLGKVANQHGTQAAVLPRIGDGNREFATGTCCIYDISRS